MNTNILFEDKNSWFTVDSNGNKDWSFSEDKINNFNDALENLIKKQSKKTRYNLDYIHFPEFNAEIFFKNNKICKRISFNNAVFHGITDFFGTIFDDEVNFTNTRFHSLADFDCAIFNKSTAFYKTTFENKATFKTSEFEEVVFNNVNFKETTIFKQTTFKDARFRGVTFDEWVSFKNITVNQKIDFTYSRTNDFIDFSDSNIHLIDLEHTRFSSAGLLNLKGLNKENQIIAINKTNFANKESARLIKAHFEKQNNITEANKYFRIEQEKYIDYLQDKNSSEHNKKATLTTLYLNKLVSNFSTDWIRALLFLIMFGYLAMLGYMWLDNMLGLKSKDIVHFSTASNILYVILMAFSWFFIYLATYFEEEKWYLLVTGVLLGSLAVFTNWGDVRTLTNYIVQITNPINAFKDMELYKGIEFYAVFIRINVAAIIYQFIVAFRQNTRRS